MSLTLDLDGLDGCLLSHAPVATPAALAPAASTPLKPVPAPRRLRAIAAGVGLGLCVPAALFLVLHAPGATEVVAPPLAAPVVVAAVAAPAAEVVVAPRAPVRPVPTGSWEVHFPSEGAEVSASAPSWLLDCPRVLVVGHTCSRGDPARNVTLARSRAEAMVARVVLAGVPAERIDLRSAADTEPVAPNETLAGRRLNRRAVASCTLETAP